MRSALLWLACWFCALPLRGADFDAANQLYDQGKFAEARSAYEGLVAGGKGSANLFYNLGNTHHRLGAPGPAMLSYERALVLDSRHPEARANLDFLRSQTGAVPWPTSWIDWLFPARWADVAVVVGMIAVWVAVFLLAGMFLTPRREKLGLWIGVTVLLSLVGYAAMVVWSAEQGRALAIVTEKTVEAHLAPAESSTPGAVLPAGSQVRVLSVRGDWIYCALPTQGRGWISTKALGRIREEAS